MTLCELVNTTFDHHEDDGDSITNVGFGLLGAAELLWSIFLFVINAFSFRVLISKEFKNTCNRLLAILVFSDNLHILCTIFVLIFIISGNFQLIRLTYMTQLHSLWILFSLCITISLGIERLRAMLSLHYSIESAEFSNQRLAKYSLPALLAAVAFHIPSFLEPRCHDHTSQGSNSTSLSVLSKENKDYYFGYKDAARIVIFAVVPFLTLVFLYARIYCEVRRIKQTSLQLHNKWKTHHDAQVELQQSRRLMLISIVYFIFLIIYIIKKTFVAVCYKPHLTLPAHECIEDPPLSSSMLRASWIVFTDSTSIVNFAILIFTGSKYRRRLLEVLRSTKKKLFGLKSTSE